ncbi:MAG: leucyl/phenylalanyl-tRNA--protein transferase [Porticoccus sp.]|nr:leucyl/phenylalanyl-tRNA--protein transferase [Porticoccus sp.]MBQ0806457.1 leucyl/phenylalanyl-tRNA--protein transferase [Porticoccus sp.]
MTNLILLDSEHPVFPCPDMALADPDGLLAVGGNLEPSTLLAAYRQGIFPWYEDDQPLLWWSPDPRTVIFPEDIKISRSLRKVLRQKNWDIRLDTAFLSVITQCAAPRKAGHGETWITDEMKAAYVELHRQGYAHSLEIWRDEQLIGGLYGVLIGAVFCGESMFSLERDASKVALVQLAMLMKHNTCGGVIDCQVSNSHLLSMGAVDIPRHKFLTKLEELGDKSCSWPDIWQFKIPEK